MRRAIALLLCLAMLALCGCSQNVSGEVVPAEEPAQDVSGEVAPVEEAEAPVEEQAEEPAPAEEDDLQLGTYAGGIYENLFLGIGCELDENWSYADQDALAQLMGLTAGSFNDEELAEQFLSADMFYDMQATADDGLVSINVLMENLGILYGTVVDEEQYLEITRDSFHEDMPSAGFSNIETEPNTIYFAGAERPGLHVSSTIQDVPYYCQQVYIKQGSYMATITMTSLVEDICASVADYFYAI